MELFIGAFAKLRKVTSTVASSCLFVCLSVRIKELSFH